MILAASALLLALPLPASAQSILGLWSTSSGGGRVEIYRCANALCGRLVDADVLRSNPGATDRNNRDSNLRTRRLKGLVVLQGFTGGPTAWSGGPLYDPQSGDGARSGTLKLRPDGVLEVAGCVLFVCRTKQWRRVRG